MLNSLFLFLFKSLMYTVGLAFVACFALIALVEAMLAIA